MNRILLASLLLVSNFCFAQKKDLYKYIIVAPDTVIQGKEFEITYFLIATNYKEWKMEEHHPFVFIRNQFSNTVKLMGGMKYYAVENKVRYTHYGTGRFSLPQISVVVSGKKCMPQSKEIYVKPNPKYGTEYALAKNVFWDNNVDIDTCHMVVSDILPNILVLSDDKHKLSAAVVKNAEELKINPVLYWSTESASDINNKNKNKYSFQRQIFTYYDKQIQQLRGAGNHNTNFHVSSYSNSNETVLPLLSDIRYGQDDPYNLYSPVVENERVPIGCVPTAMAQIMAYYKHPNAGVGRLSYNTTFQQKEYIVSKDFSNIKMLWNEEFLPDYAVTTDSAKIKSIAKLMVALSGSVRASFAKEETSAKLNEVKMSLINFWGYAASMRYCRTDNADTICGLILCDLDHRRIPIVADNTHAFLCDGHQGMFLHFNLGWKGFCNGYYQALHVEGTKDKFPIQAVVIGIEPEKTGKISKTLHVKKPNTLKTLLTQDEVLNLSSLVLSGTLGNSDITLLRQMLGAPNTDCFTPSGKLRELDLCKVKFHTERNSYYKKIILHGYAGRSWVERTTVNDFGGTQSQSTETKFTRNYNFDTMSKLDWFYFKQAGMHKDKGCLIAREDGNYVKYYFTQSQVISPAMFLQCENLSRIVLPKNTKEIKDNSFNGCVSLQEIVKPNRNIDIGKYTFENTPMLDY